MYVRVVRFPDVENERVDALLARIDEAGGPPPGVAMTGLTRSGLAGSPSNCRNSTPTRVWNETFTEGFHEPEK